MRVTKVTLVLPTSVYVGPVSTPLSPRRWPACNPNVVPISKQGFEACSSEWFERTKTPVQQPYGVALTLRHGRQIGNEITACDHLAAGRTTSRCCRLETLLQSNVTYFTLTRIFVRRSSAGRLIGILCQRGWHSAVRAQSLDSGFEA